MKKLILIIILAFLTSVLFSQRKSNYEKYWQAREDSITKSQMTLSKDTTEKQITSEYDDLYYLPSEDNKNIVKTKKVVINNYDYDNVRYDNYRNNVDPFFYYNRIRFYHNGSMNMWFNYNYYNDYWYFNNYSWFDYGFGWNTPYHNSWYWGYNNYWYTPRYNNHNIYCNNFYVHNQQPKQNVQYGHRERPSNLINNRRVIPQQKQQDKKVGVNVQQNKRNYSENRRTYTPSYSQPRMNVIPEYNNSENINSTPQRRIETNTQSRTYSAPNVQRSTQSRTYSAPSKSYNSGSSNINNNSNRRSSSSGNSDSSGNSSSSSTKRR